MLYDNSMQAIWMRPRNSDIQENGRQRKRKAKMLSISSCSDRSMTSHWRITSLSRQNLRPSCHTQPAGIRRSDSGRHSVLLQKGEADTAFDGALTYQGEANKSVSTCVGATNVC